MKSRSFWRFLLFLFISSLAAGPVVAVQFIDNFNGTQTNWFAAQPNWGFINPAAGAYFYRCDCSSNSTTWDTNAVVGSNWLFQADIKFCTLYGNGATTGVATLGLSKPTGTYSSKLAVNVTDNSTGQVLIQAEYNDGSFHTVIDSGWLTNAAPSYHVWFARPASNYFQVVVLATNGFYFNATSPPVPVSALDQVAIPGFRVNGAVVDFAEMRVDTPITNINLGNSQLASTNSNLRYLPIAITAVNDLLSHWWIGSADAGQIANTWNGYTTNLPDARGGLWERGMCYVVLTDLWRTTRDPVLQQMLASDWRRTESLYSTNQLQSCGQDSGVNWAVDDAGWSSVMYLDAYDVTGDPTALLCAKGLVNNAFNRWLDSQFGGGLWYSDAKQIKSLYQIAIVLSSLRIYELTGDQSYYDRAMQCYTWMETYLLRSDNLYWCDYNSSGPAGKDRPNQIAETNSVVSLGNALGMTVLHARLYRLTGDTNYLNRAIRTANGIYNSPLLTSAGIYLDDRDAWTQGTFAGDWAREVLSLPGIDPKHWVALWKTAVSIFTKDRTNGYYGGSWAGPAEGPGSAWSVNGSQPEQIITSSSSANMIMAAAAAESVYTNIVVPRLQISTSPGNVSVKTLGQPFWQYQLQSSTDLVDWSAVVDFYTGPTSSGAYELDSATIGPQTFFRAIPLVHP